jgi:hypothetical protein
MRIKNENKNKNYLYSKVFKNYIFNLINNVF